MKMKKTNHGKRLMDNEMISLANILRPSESSVDQDVSLDHDDTTREEEQEQPLKKKYAILGGRKSGHFTIIRGCRQFVFRSMFQFYIRTVSYDFLIKYT